MPLSSSPAWSRPSPVAGPAPPRHGAQTSTTPEGREPNGSPRFIRRELTEGAVALFRVRLVLAAIAVVVPACSSSDQQASPSSGASRASSRSAAAPASGLTGEIAIGAGDGHLWLINAKTGARLQVPWPERDGLRSTLVTRWPTNRVPVDAVPRTGSAGHRSRRHSDRESRWLE